MISAFDEEVNEGCHQTFDSSLDSLFIFGIPIIGYVYSPFEEIPNYAPLFGLSPFLYLSFRDFGCGKAMSFDDLCRKDRPNKESVRNELAKIQFS
jgi:hypothetical protein